MTTNKFIDEYVEAENHDHKVISRTLSRSYTRKKIDNLFKDINELTKGLSRVRVDECDLDIGIGTKELYVNVLTVMGEVPFSKEEKEQRKLATVTSRLDDLNRIRVLVADLNERKGTKYKIKE